MKGMMDCYLIGGMLISLQKEKMRKHNNILSNLFPDIKLMNEEVLLNQLEELADKLEILVRDENVNIDESSTTGGLCRIEGKYVLILNSQATIKEKIQVMIKALQQFDLSDMYIKPVIRELLEGENHAIHRELTLFKTLDYLTATFVKNAEKDLEKSEK
jgi:hypothetical protein